MKVVFWSINRPRRRVCLSTPRRSPEQGVLSATLFAQGPERGPLRTIEGNLVSTTVVLAGGCEKQPRRMRREHTRRRQRCPEIGCRAGGVWACAASWGSIRRRAAAVRRILLGISCECLGPSGLLKKLASHAFSSRPPSDRRPDFLFSSSPPSTPRAVPKTPRRAPRPPSEFLPTAVSSSHRLSRPQRLHTLFLGRPARHQHHGLRPV